LYTSVNNRDSSSSILSFREIVGVVVVFSFVLYLLFPKENLDQIIEGKSKNRNLSINYLESMLLYYPNSLRIKKILIENYEYTGKLRKALYLTRELLKSIKDKESLNELYKSEYLLMKKLYFKTGENKLLAELKEKLYHYFQRTEENPDYTFFFAESTQIDFKKLKYVSLKGFLKERPELINYDFEKDAFIQALALEYKEDAYGYLLHLLEYPEFEEELNHYALSLLLKHKNYEKATILIEKMFLLEETKEKKIKYFNIALYMITQSSKHPKEDILKLVGLYQKSINLDSSDIAFLLKSLLQVGEIKGAGIFAKTAFREYRNRFDENVTTLAIQSLTYNKELLPALEIAHFAKNKFNTIAWLDKNIQLSLWLGKMQDVIDLNIEGYRKYGNLKYEYYILNSCTLNNAYEILGEIYSRNVKNRDYTSVEKLSEYYIYTGKIAEAEVFFTTILNGGKNRKIEKEAILFSYRNSHYKKGLKLYKRFKKRYGIDKTLHDLSVKKLIALKKYKEAYAYAKELKEDKRLLDLGWLQRDYSYIFTHLWRAEEQNCLAYGNYDKLIKLESVLNRGKRLPYIYEKLWKKSKKRVYLTSLFYQYLEREDFKAIEKLLKTLTPKDRDSFEKNIQYHIALANYYIKLNHRKMAMREYKKALALNFQDASIHQAYLWFLLDNELIKPLKKELALLIKDRRLQNRVGFPSVITALKFQKSDLALKWLKPLLKNSDKIEYQVVYADLLELQDREAGATRIRLQLFSKLNKMVNSSPKLLKDKAFARVYLGLALRFKTPYEKRITYFKRFKSLFSKKDLLEMKIGWYTHNQSSAMVRYLAIKNHINLPWLNLYLAMSLKNNRLKQQLLKEYSILPFRDRVMASLDIGDIAGAYSLAFKGMNENSQDVELFKLYNHMINRDYPKASFQLDYRELNPNLSALGNRLSYRWNLNKGLESELLFSYQTYTNEEKRNRSNSRFTFLLKNSYKRFLWRASLSQNSSKENFISTLIGLKYSFNGLDVGIISKYQNPTKETPYLEINGMESSQELTLSKFLTQSIQISLNYKKSDYLFQDKREIGTREHLQLMGSYLLRTGYPDIRFNGYINHNRYNSTVENLLPNDFIEVGTQFSIGTSSKDTLHTSLRPFATFGLAINNSYTVGTSLSMGISGSFNGGDILTATFDYTKGINALSQPFYGLSLGYQF